MTGPDYLVCANAHAPLAARGSDYSRFCSRCQRRVMIAPSGQACLKQQPELVILCAECFLENPPLHEVIRPVSSREQILKEIRKAEPNWWRKRN